VTRFLVAIAAAAACAGGAGAAERGDAPFVVTYTCDGGRTLVIGYPAYRDARKAPIRVSWQGKTIEMAPARAGSGARYVNVEADLEWWNKGNGGDLYRLTRHLPILSDCKES
jgi:membrane-bound inhibitor of C-type lysozyme